MGLKHGETVSRDELNEQIFLLYKRFNSFETDVLHDHKEHTSMNSQEVRILHKWLVFFGNNL